jgi:ribonuclease T1
MRDNPVLFSGRPLARRRIGKMTHAALVAAVVMGFSTVSARTGVESVQAGSEVRLSQLPAEAQVTHRLILSGGPFPYRKDGTVFMNRERFLPSNPRGFYREYTVPTPGARDRGARRIVCGGQAVRAPDACYYTGNHYASFDRIVP